MRRFLFRVNIADNSKGLEIVHFISIFPKNFYEMNILTFFANLLSYDLDIPIMKFV